MKKSHEAAVHALASKKSKKSKVRSIHVHKAKGGYLAEHHMDGQGEPERHVVPDMAALQKHMASAFSEEQAEPQGETPAEEQSEMEGN